MAISKKTKKRADTGLTVVIVIGILAILNFFSYQIFHRFDLTQNKDYSISSVSRNLAAGLDDIVNIKVYFSDALPAQYISLRQDVGDILDEYKNYSKGKIRVEFIDPAGDTALEQQVQALGIPQLQFNVYNKDKIEVAKGYLGIAIQHGDKSQVIPVVDNTRNLEYQVSMAIKKVTSAEVPTVGFYTGDSSLSTNSDITAAYKTIQQLYNVKLVDLSDGGTIPDDVKTLIIAGPKDPFTEDQLKQIDAFLMRGNSILALVDGVKVENGLIPSVNDTGLNGLFAKYGLTLNKNLVLDTSSGIASFSQGFISFSTNYPYWPKIVDSGFNQDSAAVAKLQSVILPWASSVDLDTNTIPEGDQTIALMKTTDQAWQETGNFDLNPQQPFYPSGGQKQFTLAASIFGKFNSAYATSSTDMGRLTVVGDSDFITDRILASAPDNLILFQNLVDSLTMDEDLINIRSKGISDRPIKELSDGAKAGIRYFNVFGLTLIVVLFGMIRYFMRRRSRFVDDL